MDTLLAIASRRDERRTLPEPLPPELDEARARRRQALGLVQERAAVDVRRADRAGPGSRSSRARCRCPRTCWVQGSSSRSSCAGRGRCCSTPGARPRACCSPPGPSGLPRARTGSRTRGLARTVLERDGRRGAGDRALVRPAGAAPRRGAAHGRGMERAGEPQADRRGRAMAVVTRMKGGLDLGGTKIQAVVTNGESMVLGSARRETPRKGGPRGGRLRARRGAARGARRCRCRADGSRRDRRRRAGVDRRRVGHRAPGGEHRGLGRPVPARADARRRAREARPDRERRQRGGRCRASLRCRSWAQLVPRRLLGHGRRRRHRDGRPEAHGPWLGRRDRARLLEARRPPCNCGLEGCVEAYAGRGRSRSGPARSPRSARRCCSS